MPWVQQGNKRYFYHNERVGRRVVRRYHGNGPAAELAAAAAELRRLERVKATRERQEQLAQYQQAVAPLLDLCVGTDMLARAALFAAGFHQHEHGTWRRRRGSRSTS
jgi:hypothetical protein